jgi:hypothetical protein
VEGREVLGNLDCERRDWELGGGGKRLGGLKRVSEEGDIKWLTGIM